MKIIPKGTVILVSCDTGYCGMDSHQHYRLASDYTEEELDDFVWQEALSNAEMYGIYPESYDSDEEEEEDYPGDNIGGTWEIVSEKDMPDEKYISEL